MIRIGIAGWDYADWVGTVYPATGSARLDRLAFVSRFVDVVEINSTFYRPAAARTAESWLQRTAARGDAFSFAAKLHRSWTHVRDPDPGPQQLADLAGLRVLLDAGKLTALLAQFPQSFHYDGRAVDWLVKLRDLLAGWPLVVEVRHAGWQSEAAREKFDGLGVGWCVVDQPRVGASTARPVARVTSEPGYLRLHGRNRQDWFREGAGRNARYDYLYDDREVAEMATIAREMAGAAEELIVVQNNHFRGQALVNALQLKHLVQGAPPRAPESLVAAYPPLERHVVAERSRLF
jgi:uncharacterized protein YecE (DUF72 family)